MAIKGFIKNGNGEKLLPITRAELVLDRNGQIALHSNEFLAVAPSEGNDGLPGLMTAAEKAMLNGTGDGQNLTDIYGKLNALNESLYVNNTLFDVFGKDPINLANGTGIVIVTNTNNSKRNVSINLAGVTTTTEGSGRISDITVDDYGRVTKITKSSISNEELPNPITAKTLKSCVVDTTDQSTWGDSAVVNKKYVDDAFNRVTGIAAGALQFKGSLSDQTTAYGYLQSQNTNYYFIVTGAGFAIATNKLFNDEIANGATSVNVKNGDTLIVYNDNDVIKFVYIPSADEKNLITFTDGSDSITSGGGNIQVNFAAPFDVTVQSNVATVTMPVASVNQDGYLSSTDYAQFLSNFNSLKVEYTGNYNNDAVGQYEIGVLTIGTLKKSIIGINNISALSLDSISNVPTLVFTENGQEAAKIGIKAGKGISTSKNGNDLIITSAHTVNSDSTNRLKINDDASFSIQMGSASNRKGLIDYDTLEAYATNAHTVYVQFEEVSTMEDINSVDISITL